MAYKNTFQNVHRKSEEHQLLSEEKWIIEALAKIKNQRNCLQIERLHLESLKMKARAGPNKEILTSLNVQSQEEPVASTSAVNLMQHVSVKSGAENDIVEYRHEDALCNEEELNLVVTNPVYNIQNADSNMEEDEEEESDNDVFIDINMFMNGEFK